MLVAVVMVSTLISTVDRPPPVGAASTGTCGVERWSVKTGTDPDAGTVDQTKVSPTTVGYLDGLAAPASRPENNRPASRPCRPGR